MEIYEYRERFPENDAAPGWIAIDERLEKFYPGIEPKHYASVPHYALGGDFPLDGISIYRCQTGTDWHYHYVTYGFSNLYYDEETINDPFSGFGFELTFRLKPFAQDAENPTWVVTMLQNLARYVFKTGNGFDENHWLAARGPIRLETESELVGLVFVTDPVLGSIDTPHGKVKFIQAVGITSNELQAIRDDLVKPEAIIARLKSDDSFLVTDLERKSI